MIFDNILSLSLWKNILFNQMDKPIQQVFPFVFRNDSQSSTLRSRLLLLQAFPISSIGFGPQETWTSLHRSATRMSDSEVYGDRQGHAHLGYPQECQSGNLIDYSHWHIHLGIWDWWPLTCLKSFLLLTWLAVSKSPMSIASGKTCVP